MMIILLSLLRSGGALLLGGHSHPPPPPAPAAAGAARALVLLLEAAAGSWKHQASSTTKKQQVPSWRARRWLPAGVVAGTPARPIQYLYSMRRRGSATVYMRERAVVGPHSIDRGGSWHFDPLV